MSKCAVLWQVVCPASSCCSEKPKEFLNHHSCWECSLLHPSLSQRRMKKSILPDIPAGPKRASKRLLLGPFKKRSQTHQGCTETLCNCPLFLWIRKSNWQFAVWRCRREGRTVTVPKLLLPQPSCPVIYTARVQICTHKWFIDQFLIVCANLSKMRSSHTCLCWKKASLPFSSPWTYLLAPHIHVPIQRQTWITCQPCGGLEQEAMHVTATAHAGMHVDGGERDKQQTVGAALGRNACLCPSVVLLGLPCEASVVHQTMLSLLIAVPCCDPWHELQALAAQVCRDTGGGRVPACTPHVMQGQPKLYWEDTATVELYSLLLPQLLTSLHCPSTCRSQKGSSVQL